MRKLVLCAVLAIGGNLHAATRPNIVVILVDDMGWSDIGCYGSEIPTPNVDSLARNGLRFTQFYNTGRCSPTRASLLTGHYPHQAGMGHLDNMVVEGSRGFHGRLADTSVTLGEVLRDAGYFTAMTGKWHVGQQHGTPPWTRGFMRSLNLQAGGVYFPNQSGKSQAKLYLNGEAKALDAPLFGDDWYSTYLWSKWGLKFIDEAIAEEKPFFLYLAFCAPHFPLMAPAEDIARYRGKYVEGWDRLRETRHRRQIEMGLVDAQWPLTPRPKDSPAWGDVSPAERERFDHMMAIYAAMIETMDRSVGTLVDGLRKRGVLDNTLILFLSDNGGNAESGPNGRYEGESPGGPNSTVFLGQNWATLNNTPFRRYKHYTHEGGISTPLIAHWPAGIPRQRNGRLERQPGHLVDIMATLVDVGGAKYPATLNGHSINPMEGVSLRPAFAGESLSRRAPIFFEHEGNRAVRDGKWKLVSLFKGPWELYDMERDRTELNDLSKEHPDIVARLSAQYDAWARRANVDPWPPLQNKAAKPKPQKKKGAGR